MTMIFKTKPYKHQQHAVNMAREIGNVGLLWEMGTGKTKGMIDILRSLFMEAGRVKKTLIFSPLITLYNWEEEFQIHSNVPKERVHVLSKGGSKGKIKNFLRFAMDQDKCLTGEHIFITNYESVQSPALMSLILEWRPEVVVLDEAHYIKNPKAKRSKLVVKLGDLTRHKFILTGTPILNSIKDIFNLFRFLDEGATFGKNFNVFCNTFMEDENASWAGKAGYFPKLVARVDKFDELTNKIYTKCHRVLKKDVLKDLPPLIKTTRLVDLSPQQLVHYKEMERDFITFIKEKKDSDEPRAVVAQLAVTKALRLQQICTGYVTTEDGDDIILEKIPRLEATKELLEEIVVDGKNKCILWCSFRTNYKMLGRLCTEMGINHGFITGDMSLEEKRDSMNRFNTGDMEVIIANRRAGGIGVNLVAAAYSIVYSRNFSLGEELQSEARNHRGGSQIHQQIVKIDLAARDTIDGRVLEALQDKQDISDKIIDIVGGSDDT